MGAHSSPNDGCHGDSAYFDIPKDNVDIEMTMLGGGLVAVLVLILYLKQHRSIETGTPIQVTWTRKMT